MRNFILGILIFCMGASVFAARSEDIMINKPSDVAKALTDINVFVMPQPKEIAVLDNSLSLLSLDGIVYKGKSPKKTKALKEFPSLLKDRTGVSLKMVSQPSDGKYITIGIISDPSDFPAIDAKALKAKGEQAYAVSVTSDGIQAAANDEAGLFYAMETVSQIFCLSTSVNGIYILDYPSIKYRGMMYDISRGQMPKPETLKSLAREFASAKGNMFELYLEDMFEWEKYPDIAPPDALSKAECLDLFNYAADYYTEVHPMMQVLGHFERIGSKPNYAKYLVERPKEDIGTAAWTSTIDVRNPEAVQFVCNLLDEICQAFPGKYLNVDVTEIAAIGYEKSGTPEADLPQLMLKYIDTLADVCRRHDMKLLVAQSQLSATGHLNGLGAVINDMPKDIPIASYYTAEFYGGWEHDFSLMKEKGIEFWANPWLTSHTKFMPNTTHAADFSDITSQRGLQYGVTGSVSCDWGDYGHIHLPGVIVYPSMYHCASAWTGGQQDRDYFDRAFSAVVFGANTDLIAKGIRTVGDINEVPVEKINENGETVVWATHNTGNLTLSHHFKEFFGDILEDGFIAEIVNPKKRGEAVLAKALKGQEMLAMAKPQIKKNQDIYEQLVWSARPYKLIGERLILRYGYLNQDISDKDFAAALDNMSGEYYNIREEYINIYKKHCLESAQYENNINQMKTAGDLAKALSEKLTK